MGKGPRELGESSPFLVTPVSLEKKSYSLFFNFFKYIRIHIHCKYCVCVCLCVHACAHAQIRGQFIEISSLLLGSWGWNSGHYLGSKRLEPQSHLEALLEPLMYLRTYSLASEGQWYTFSYFTAEPSCLLALC